MGMNFLASAALRVIPGAFIVNSGISKLGLDQNAARALQQMAETGIPQVKDLDAGTFGKALAFGEIAVGSALLAPFIPNRLAGLGLGAFSAGLLSMYFGNDEMTTDGVRPTQQGIPLAKDSWLASIAIALVLGGGSSRKGNKKNDKS